MNIIEYLTKIIKSNFKSIFKIVSISVFIVFVYSYFLAEKTYMSESKLFVSGESSSVAELKSLAMQYGVSLPQSKLQMDLSSPALFTKLAETKTVLIDLANQKFTLTNGNQIILKDYLNEDRELNDTQIFQKMNGKISISLEKTSGVITLLTILNDQLLAQQVNEKLIELVNERFTEIKRSQTTFKRKFVESRIIELGQELKDSEIEIKEFKELNRSFSSSPQLTLELNTLTRANRVIETVYLMLKEQLESMKLQEVEDERPLVIIDPPNYPDLKYAPITSRNMIYTFILSTFFSIYYFAVIRNSISKHNN